MKRREMLNRASWAKHGTRGYLNLSTPLRLGVNHGNPLPGFSSLYKVRYKLNTSCTFVLYRHEKRRAFGNVFTGWPFVFLCFAGGGSLFGGF
jgi:hypothetical protein